MSTKKKPTQAALTTQATMQAVKESLIGELRRLGAKKVVIEYDGSGDSGEINSIDIDGADEDQMVNVLGHENAGYDRETYDQKIVTTKKQERRLGDVLNDFAYFVIDAAGYSGWENNEGGFGAVTIDVDKNLVHLGHNFREENSEPSTQEIR